MTEQNLFSTKDISLAASLMSMKFLMVGVDYQIEGLKNLAVGYFKFENSEELSDARRKYMQAMILVEPRNFMSNIKTLKSEVQSTKDNPSNH